MASEGIVLLLMAIVMMEGLLIEIIEGGVIRNKEVDY